MNELRDSINQMREERGEPPLSEEELPTEPDEAVYRWWSTTTKSSIVSPTPMTRERSSKEVKLCGIRRQPKPQVH